MDEKTFSMDKISIHQSHPWMEKSYPCMKVSFMEKTKDDFFIFAALKTVKYDRRRDVTQGQTDVKVEMII